MRKFKIITWAASLIIILPALAYAANPPRVLNMTGNIPVPGANFKEIKLQPQDKTLVPCANVQGTVGKMIYETDGNIYVCDGANWQTPNNSTWLREEPAPILPLGNKKINISTMDSYSAPSQSIGHAQNHMRLGIGVDDPLATLHIKNVETDIDEPYGKTSLRLGYKYMALNVFWEFQVNRQAGSRLNYLTLAGGQTNDPFKAIDVMGISREGHINIIDKDRYVLPDASSLVNEGILNVQRNESATNPSSTEVDIQKLAMVLQMNINNLNAANWPTPNTPNYTPITIGDGVGLGFSVNNSAETGGAIAYRWDEDLINSNPNAGRLLFAVRNTVGSNIPSVMQLTHDGNVKIGSDNLPVAEKLEVDGNIKLLDAGSGPIYSIENVKTEPKLTGLNPTSNNKVATTEFVQTAVLAAAAQGSCFVLRKTVGNIANCTTVVSPPSWPPLGTLTFDGSATGYANNYQLSPTLYMCEYIVCMP